MADKADLRNMVLTFRVTELQTLLGLTNQSKCGRKTELLQRALMIVDRGVPPAIQTKIREMYRKYMPASRTGVLPSASTNGYNSGTLPAQSQLLTKCASASSVLTTAQGTNGIHLPAHRLAAEPEHRAAHTTVAPTRPDVNLKRLPFYDVLAEIMKPSSLIPRSATRLQETRFQIYLAQQHIEEINRNRDTRFLDRIEYNVQVQLRFCLIDSSCRQPDCFPANINVKVNNMIATLPNIIPTNKPGVEPKRPNRPVDITRLCRLSSTVVNTISISWTLDETRSHCAAVYLVRKLDSNILLQRLKRAGVRKPEHTKAMVREKLSLDDDGDISTTSLRISLLCPLGKMRMTVPVRASTCNHLQCFDAATFLMMNEKKPTWICPVCDKPADFSKLFIDGLVSEILRETVDSTEVELTRDGQWHVTKTEELDCPSPDPPTVTVAAAKQHVIQNIIEADSPVRPAPTATTKPSAAAAAATNGNSGATAPAASGGGDVIDLTESDDEGPVMQPAPAHQPPNNSKGGSGRTATATYSKHSSSSAVSSSPRSSLGLSSPSPPIAICDLSPLHIPAVSSSPLLPPSPPLNLLAPTPPLAHTGSYRSVFPTSSASSTVASSKYPSAFPTSLLPGVSSYPSVSSHYPGSSLFAPSPYDNLASSSDAMLDFLSLMSNISDFGGFSLPPNTFDYLYQATGPGASAPATFDLGLDSLRRSPTPRS